MDLRSTSAERLSEAPVATLAEMLTSSSSICPACGYPALGMELCAYCRPLIQSPPGGGAMGLVFPAT